MLHHNFNVFYWQIIVGKSIDEAQNLLHIKRLAGILDEFLSPNDQLLRNGAALGNIVGEVVEEVDDSFLAETIHIPIHYHV